MSAVRLGRHVCCETRQTVWECIHASKRGAKREGARLLVGVVDIYPALTLGLPLGHPWVKRGSTSVQPGSPPGEWWPSSFILLLLD